MVELHKKKIRPLCRVVFNRHRTLIFATMSDTKQQKALFLQSKQGQFVVGSHSIPKPGKDELLIQVYSAALNPVDYKVQEQGIFVENYPAIIGEDIAGMVDEVGEGVRNFMKGDRV